MFLISEFSNLQTVGYFFSVTRPDVKQAWKSAQGRRQLRTRPLTPTKGPSLPPCATGAPNFWSTFWASTSAGLCCSQAALESVAAEVCKQEQQKGRLVSGLLHLRYPLKSLSALEGARSARRQAGPFCGGQGACAQLSSPLRALPGSLDLGLVTLKRVSEVRIFPPFFLCCLPECYYFGVPEGVGPI